MKGPVYAVVILLLLAVTATSVHGKRPRRRNSKTSIATYNTGLVSGYPQLDSRAALLAEKLKDSKVDIWCLQEVWYADVQRELYAAVETTYKYALSAINLTDSNDNGEVACSTESMTAVDTCVSQSNCGGQSYNNTSEVAACVSLSCGSIISGLPDTCRDCVIFKMAVSLESVSSCSTTENASRYETTYGLMILSKKELKDTDYGGITNQSQFRGYLKATVEDVGVLMCVHLSSTTFSPLYVGPPIVSPFLYSSYAEQQYKEISVLMNLMEGEEEPIFLGDFNHGPVLPGDISEVLPFHYGLMSASGLFSPYVAVSGLCTWCGGGLNYAAATNVPYDYILDHIYISARSHNRVLKVKRLFEGSTVETSTSPSIDLPLSDHYGVLVVLQDYRFDCSWRERFRYVCKTEEESTKFRGLASLEDSRDDLCGSMKLKLNLKKLIFN